MQKQKLLSDVIMDTAKVMSELSTQIIQYLYHKKIHCDEIIHTPSGILDVYIIDGNRQEFITKDGDAYDYTNVSFEVLAQLYFIAEDVIKKSSKRKKKKLPKKKPVVKNKVLNKWINISSTKGEN